MQAATSATESYILVTGGLGYIGSHTVVELIEKENENVIIVDNLDNSNIKCLDRVREITGADENKLKFFQLDILDEKAMDEQIFMKHTIKSVIHFAGLKAVGESISKPLEYYHNNVSGSITLLRLVKAHNVKTFVFSSSACVYGDNAACKEEDKIQPTNPYGQTKAMIEQVMKDYAASDSELTMIALRYFNPIGAHASGKIGESPNDIPNNLMPYIMRVANGHLPYLGIFGDDYETVDGTGVRDYIHIIDLARGHTASLKKAKELSGYNVFNLGTGNGTSVKQLIAAFEKASGITIKTEQQARRPGDCATVLAKPDLANQVLSWRTQYTVEEMCRDTWNWTKANPNGYE